MSQPAHAAAIDRAHQVLLAEWEQRGQQPVAAGSDWLQGPWGEVLAAVEQRSRSGADHLPLATLLHAARELARQAQASAGASSAA